MWWLIGIGAVVIFIVGYGIGESNGKRIALRRLGQIELRERTRKIRNHGNRPRPRLQPRTKKK